MGIVFRKARVEDAEALLDIYAPYVENTAVTFEMNAPTVEEFRARIKRVSYKFPYIVCEVDGEIAAYAYFAEFKDRAAYKFSIEGSMYISDAHQSRGLGTALYRCMLALARELGYCTMIGGITMPNAKSEGMHSKLGFSEVGVFKKCGYKLGKWQDVKWLQLQLREYEADPAEPLGIDELPTGRYESLLNQYASSIK